MSRLLAIAISMHINCRICQASILVAGIVDKAWCRQCGNYEPIPVQRWRGFFDSAIHDTPALQEKDDPAVMFDQDNAMVRALVKHPVCPDCDKPLPDAALDNAQKHGKCFCTSCGHNMAVRPVPPEFQIALPRITHLLGEDPAQLAAASGGPQQPKEAPLLTKDKIIEEAKQRIRSGRGKKAGFYLLYDSSLPMPLGRAHVQWGVLKELVCDPNGIVYGIGADDGSMLLGGDRQVLFALDRQLRTLWAQRALPLEGDIGGLQWRNDGTLFVWSPERYSVIMVRAADGEVIGTLGGQQPPNFGRHVLDMSKAKSLAIDHDGSMLITKAGRMARCAPDGSALPTWPPGHGIFGSLFDEKPHPWNPPVDEDGAEYLSLVGNHPTRIKSAHAKIGWDGKLYLQNYSEVGAWDRDGKKLWFKEIEGPEWGRLRDFAVDARGIAYALCDVEDDTSAIHRIMPNGNITHWVDGRNPQTPMREELRLAVHPDGTVFAATYSRKMRIFAPDGRVLFISDESQKEDREWNEKRARAVANDRVR
jgi:hypothetical protein